MNRMRPMRLPALLAMSGLGLWGSSASAQYVGGRNAYAPRHYYAVGPGYYGSGYSYAPRPVAGPYSAAAASSFRSSVVVPGGLNGRNYPAPAPSGRPVLPHNFGLEPESLPAQIAEDIAPAPAAPRLGPTWRAGWWRGRMWRRTSRSW
jgi:hypothetical protein